jgi:hypothetical protein
MERTPPESNSKETWTREVSEYLEVKEFVVGLLETGQILVRIRLLAEQSRRE